MIRFIKEWWSSRRASPSSKAESAPADEAATDADTSTPSEPTTPPAIPDEVEVELQRRFNELRAELLDAREKTIDRWLTILGIAFPILALIGVLYSVKEFEEIKTQAQSYVEEIERYRDLSEAHEARLRHMTAQTVADDPTKARQFIEDVRENPKASSTDKAIAKAVSLQEQGNEEEALKIWRGIADAFEKVDRELSARAYFSVGYLLIQQEKPEDAIAAYDEAVRLKRDFAEAYNNRGIAKYALGRHEDAITDYNQAIRLKPDPAKAYINRGNVKYALGRHEDAITDYNQAIRLKPDLAKAYYNRDTVKAKLGRREDAITDYNQAIQLKPDYAEAYHNRGNAKDKLGRREDAITDYNQAIQLKPDYAEAYYNRGNAKAKLGRREDAITDYNQAIQLKPDYAEAHHNRGNMKSKLGRTDEARQDFEKARDLAHKAGDPSLVALVEKRLRDLDNQEGE